MILKKTVSGDFDKELIPLLKELNKAGIKTIASCIGHDKIAGLECQGYIAIDMKSLKMVRFDSNMLVLDFIYKGKRYLTIK